jgi:site-specific recombinase XerC
MSLLARSAVFSSNSDLAAETPQNPDTSPPNRTDLVLVVHHGPLDRHPAAIYLASLAPGSRRTMRGALRTIARILTGETDELQVPWHLVDYAHATIVRTVLAERLAPATANRMLASLRGTLKAAFKLGVITADHYTRAAMIEPVRGSRIAKGRALSPGELRSLFEVCDATTAAGARDAGLLGLLYGLGLRRSEVVALDLECFDRSTGSLTVRGKGNRERKGWVTNGSFEAVEAWLACRGAEPGPLFFPVCCRSRQTEGIC